MEAQDYAGEVKGYAKREVDGAYQEENGRDPRGDEGFSPGTLGPSTEGSRVMQWKRRIMHARLRRRRGDRQREMFRQLLDARFEQMRAEVSRVFRRRYD